MLLVASKHFQKQLETFSVQDQEKVLKTLKTLRASLENNRRQKGLGFKKIGHDKYEIRASLKIRIGIKQNGDTFVADLLGNHEDIRNFLKNY